MSGGATTVAVVVLNWDGWRDTARCLGWLRRQSYRRLRLVVVDNGSRDGSPDHLRAWASREGVAVHEHRLDDSSGEEVVAASERGAAAGVDRVVLVVNRVNLGFAAGCNVGLRLALACSDELVLVVNNDITAGPELVASLVGVLEEHPDWGAVAPKILEDEGDTILYAGGALRLWQARAVHLGRGRRDGAVRRGAHATGHVTAACALYRAALLRDVGLFDEGFFFGHEDAALSAAAARRGHRLGVALDCAVRHREGASLAARRPRSVYYFNKYRLLLLRKHGGRLDRLIAPLFLAVTRTVKLPWLLVRGRWREVAAELTAWWDFRRGRLADYDRARAEEEG